MVYFGQPAATSGEPRRGFELILAAIGLVWSRLASYTLQITNGPMVELPAIQRGRLKKNT
jgi:hypothetical protein